MKIIAPANTLEEATKMLDAGADCIMVGGVTTVYSNFPANGKVISIGEAHLSAAAFSELVDYCHARGCTVQYNVYTDCVSGSSEPTLLLAEYLEQYVSLGLAAGVDSFVFDDIGAIIRSKALLADKQIHASFLFDTVNFQQVRFFQELGISVVEISPQLTITEITALQQESPLALSVTVHLNCAAYEGSCYLDHFLAREDELVPIGLTCQAFFSIDYPEKGKTEQRILDTTASCSLCHLPALQEAGIHYLKVPGRHIEAALIEEWVQAYRYGSELAAAGVTDLPSALCARFPGWRIWCRMNRQKGCLYNVQSKTADYFV